jgi:hypothetical protein
MKIQHVLATMFVLAALAGGCKRKDDSAGGPPRPPQLSQLEKARSAKACMDYVFTLCTCAKLKPEAPEIQKRCNLDKALPDALKVAGDIDADPTAPAEAATAAADQARKVAATCIEGLNELQSDAMYRGCN